MIFGLTGGIATGKSTVVEEFKKEGIYIVDADKIARTILDDEKIIDDIIFFFGKIVLDEKGKIDRKKLRNIVFNDADKREELNKITHPAIFNKMEIEIKNGLENGSIVIADVPLLFETGYNKRVDKTILVSCSYETQIMRLMKRDSISRKEAEDAVKIQMSMEDKRRMSDIIIENNGSVEALILSIKELTDIIKKGSSNREEPLNCDSESNLNI